MKTLLLLSFFVFNTLLSTAQQKAKTPVKTAAKVKPPKPTVIHADSDALNGMKKYLRATEGKPGIELKAKIKELFEKAGYTFLKSEVEDVEYDILLFKFNKLTVGPYEDGTHRGFTIDFINADELLLFKRAFADSFNDVREIPYENVEAYRLVYSYEKK
jgi:hypothetical protein